MSSAIDEDPTENGDRAGMKQAAAVGQPGGNTALCASCDRCRARKTKCDGNRPCGNCAAKYLKKNKLSSIEGIDVSLFECIYSPAKRRGPVPGKAGQSRKASEVSGAQDDAAAMMAAASAGMGGGMGGMGMAGMGGMGGDETMNELQRQMLLQQQLEQQMAQNQIAGGMGAADVGMGGAGQGVGDAHLADLQRQMMLQQQMMMGAAAAGGAGGMMGDMGGMAGMQGGMGGMAGMQGGGGPGQAAADTMASQQAAAQQQLSYLQQLQQQAQQQQQQQMQGAAGAGAAGTSSASSGGQPAAQRARTADMSSADGGGKTSSGLPKSVVKHMPLLEKSNGDGNRLRSYYDLSVDELFCLPPIPTDEEYCARLSVTINPSLLPRFDLAALQAARFAEIALGALANNQVALALELSNATVMCLRECVEEPVHPSCMFDVARAYLLHGIFRSYRGDMVRYFKYRRVCLTHLSQLDNVPGVEALLAAISFHDSWAYMIHNASEDALPDIDDAIPPLPAPQGGMAQRQGQTQTEAKYGCSTNPSLIASNPVNQMWIQGPPPVFINNEAPALSRSLDALACAIRSCCDQANARFEGMARAMNAQNAANGASAAGGGGDDSSGHGAAPTPTGSAVMANESELCSRNMVLSAFTLLQQHEASNPSVNKNHGHHLLVSAMDAFLEGGDEEEAGGFTDSQIQSLLSVCNTVVEHPLLLYQGGPTYHMITNAAILLCHLLNGMHANRSGGDQPGEMEAALFDEVLDTFIAVRKLLNIHRRKLPVRLRCHGIPRPNFGAASAATGGAGAPFIDLGETLMCGSRGCQGFVLMACSPCVAAERAKAAAEKQEMIAQRDASQGADVAVEEMNEFDKELYDLGSEFDLDDDALLNVLSRIIAT